MACKNDKCGCQKATKTTLTVGVPILEIVPMEHMYQIPTYANHGDSGMDVYASEDAVIYNGQVTKVKTGLTFNIPEGYEIQVRSRSGLAKLGVIVANSPGTIDSGYRGEVCVLLTNLNQSGLGYQIHKGDRIAQLVFAPVQKVEIVVVETLNSTVRGSGGFGSSGV